MEKVMFIIQMIGASAIFLGVGILFAFFPDKTWNLLERWRKVIGDGTEYKRTPVWNISTRVAGIPFFLFGIFICYMIFLELSH